MASRILRRAKQLWAVAVSVLIATPGTGRPQAQPSGFEPPRVGAPLGRWTPGVLDIHQISTGRGNAALVVFPDSTTLLIDAGAAGEDALPETDLHPNASRTTGEWIARYVSRHLPNPAAGLDYALLTHFHIDHIGQPLASSPLDSSGSFRLAGITEVGDRVRIRTIIDRGWPSYDYPAPLTDSVVANYRRFLGAEEKKGTVIERFKAGAGDQIRLRHAASRYADVEVRNIVGNGQVWAGSGSSTRSLFPDLRALPRADWPNENMCSLGIRIAYGRFRYFTGGDLQETPDAGYPPWHDMAPVIANAIGAVDVHTVSHHGSIGAESEAFLRALASPVLIIPSWGPIHPAPDVIKRITGSRIPPQQRWIYVTDLRPSTRVVNVQRIAALSGPAGHIVVRVEPGGARYWVVVVSNADEDGVVSAVRGPLSTR